MCANLENILKTRRDQEEVISHVINATQRVAVSRKSYTNLENILKTC